MAAMLRCPWNLFFIQEGEAYIKFTGRNMHIGTKLTELHPKMCDHNSGLQDLGNSFDRSAVSIHEIWIFSPANDIHHSPSSR